ncbi:MAG: hypothetical protein ACAH12_03445 [Methylophilaceae bacterium]
MSAVAEVPVNQNEAGLFQKFIIERTDGKDAPGGKHQHDEYFVLNLTTDKNSLPAIMAYAKSCEGAYPILADDLRSKMRDIYAKPHEFVTTPEITLPSGEIIAPFQVARYLSGKGILESLAIDADNKPWVDINYDEARKVANEAGYNLISELQYLAIAYDITKQDENWTGGKVGEGKLFQGLHKGTHDGALAAIVESKDPEERRWHVLSNGERVYDFSGNAYSWVFDDVQGDENGIVAKAFAEDSPTKTTPPYGNREHGIGDHVANGDWSGNALIRGGCWYSGDRAGVFRLDRNWLDYRSSRVSFRCTKSL